MQNVDTVPKHVFKFVHAYLRQTKMEKSRYPTFHSLNAARVCAEYCVVHYHIALEGNGLLKNKDGASALMCFFFVLSGFMAMHTNMDTDFSVVGAKADYIYRRLQKVYPTYIIWILLDTPGNLVYWWDFAAGCPLFWMSIASQPILLHAWLGSSHIGTTNGVSWYLCTLFWLWLVFPFVNVKTLFSARPWMSIICLYVLSILTGVLMSGFYSVNSRELPIIRLFEFLMGCCVAFTLDRPVNGWFVVLPLLCLFTYWVVTYTMPALWYIEDAPKAKLCQLWPRQQQQSIILNPTLLLSMFSVVFCLVIHWLASTERSGKGGFSMLQWDFFKSLSTFSLHIYLSHNAISTFLKFLFNQFGILSWWNTDTLMLACYLIAYWYSKVEPKVLRWLGSFCHKDQAGQQNHNPTDNI